VPQGTVLLVGQDTCKQLTGWQHPRTVTVWLQLVELPQPSTIYHVWVMLTFGQTPFVTSPAEATKTLVSTPADVTNWLVQQVETIGGSNVQFEPHWTVLLFWQTTCRQLQQPFTVTVWLQLVVSPHPSVMDQVWVINCCGQAPLVYKPVEVTSALVRTPVEVTMPLAQQVVT